MIHGDLTTYNETSIPDPFALQNKKLLKVQLHYGPVFARIGSMVAYQGDVTFDAQGAGGAKNFLKQKLTGEGVPLMTATGQGEVFLADAARDVHIFYLEDDMITANGANVLSFSASIGHSIEKVGGGIGGAMAGGLYNTALRGTGYVAVTCHGDPVVLDVASAPTFADPNAVVCWSGGVSASFKSDFKGRDLLGKGSGEAMQCAFGGQGWVMVQPSENVVQGGGQPSGGGGLFG